jgi:hypothetical protein
VKRLLIGFECLCLLIAGSSYVSGAQNRWRAKSAGGALTNADKRGWKPGRLKSAALIGANLLSEDKTKIMQRGVWGGEHIGLWVEDTRVRLEYDCAHGTMEQPVKLDSEGRFKATGTHIRESGGPATEGEKPDSHKALYAGQVTDGKMVITVTLADTKETVGTFTLAYGQKPNLFKCK